MLPTQGAFIEHARIFFFSKSFVANRTLSFQFQYYNKIPTVLVMPNWLVIKSGLGPGTPPNLIQDVTYAITGIISPSNFEIGYQKQSPNLGFNFAVISQDVPNKNLKHGVIYECTSDANSYTSTLNGITVADEGCIPPRGSVGPNFLEGISGECLDSAGQQYDYLAGDLLGLQRGLRNCVEFCDTTADPPGQVQVGLPLGQVGFSFFEKDDKDTCVCHYNNGKIPSDLSFRAAEDRIGSGPIASGNGNPGAICFARTVRPPKRNHFSVHNSHFLLIHHYSALHSFGRRASRSISALHSLIFLP